LPGVDVVESHSPRLLLVEADESKLLDAMRFMPGWIVSEEKSFKLE
jgi:hypothetical protein